jgi:hypothetical protein
VLSEHVDLAAGVRTVLEARDSRAMHRLHRVNELAAALADAEGSVLSHLSEDHSFCSAAVSGVRASQLMGIAPGDAAHLSSCPVPHEVLVLPLIEREQPSPRPSGMQVAKATAFVFARDERVSAVQSATDSKTVLSSSPLRTLSTVRMACSLKRLRAQREADKIHPALSSGASVESDAAQWTKSPPWLVAAAGQPSALKALFPSSSEESVAPMSVPGEAGCRARSIADDGFVRGCPAPSPDQGLSMRAWGLLARRKERKDLGEASWMRWGGEGGVDSWGVLGPTLWDHVSSCMGIPPGDSVGLVEMGWDNEDEEDDGMCSVSDGDELPVSLGYSSHLGGVRPLTQQGRFDMDSEVFWETRLPANRRSVDSAHDVPSAEERTILRASSSLANPDTTPRPLKRPRADQDPFVCERTFKLRGLLGPAVVEVSTSSDSPSPLDQHSQVGCVCPQTLGFASPLDTVTMGVRLSPASKASLTSPVSRVRRPQGGDTTVTELRTFHRTASQVMQAAGSVLRASEGQAWEADGWILRSVPGLRITHTDLHCGIPADGFVRANDTVLGVLDATQSKALWGVTPAETAPGVSVANADSLWDEEAFARVISSPAAKFLMVARPYPLMCLEALIRGLPPLQCTVTPWKDDGPVDTSDDGPCPPPPMTTSLTSGEDIPARATAWLDTVASAASTMEATSPYPLPLLSPTQRGEAMRESVGASLVQPASLVDTECRMGVLPPFHGLPDSEAQEALNAPPESGGPECLTRPRKMGVAVSTDAPTSSKHKGLGSTDILTGGSFAVVGWMSSPHQRLDLHSSFELLDPLTAGSLSAQSAAARAASGMLEEDSWQARSNRPSSFPMFASPLDLHSLPWGWQVTSRRGAMVNLAASLLTGSLTTNSFPLATPLCGQTARRFPQLLPRALRSEIERLVTDFASGDYSKVAAVPPPSKRSKASRGGDPADDVAPVSQTTIERLHHHLLADRVARLIHGMLVGEDAVVAKSGMWVDTMDHPSFALSSVTEGLVSGFADSGAFESLDQLTEGTDGVNTDPALKKGGGSSAQRAAAARHGSSVAAILPPRGLLSDLGVAFASASQLRSALLGPLSVMRVSVGKTGDAVASDSPWMVANDPSIAADSASVSHALAGVDISVSPPDSTPGLDVMFHRGGACTLELLPGHRHVQAVLACHYSVTCPLLPPVSRAGMAESVSGPVSLAGSGTAFLPEDAAPLHIAIRNLATPGAKRGGRSKKAQSDADDEQGADKKESSQGKLRSRYRNLSKSARDTLLTRSRAVFASGTLMQIVPAHETTAESPSAIRLLVSARHASIRGALGAVAEARRGMASVISPAIVTIAAPVANPLWPAGWFFEHDTDVMSEAKQAVSLPVGQPVTGSSTIARVIGVPAVLPLRESQVSPPSLEDDEDDDGESVSAAASLLYAWPVTPSARITLDFSASWKALGDDAALRLASVFAPVVSNTFVDRTMAETRMLLVEALAALKATQGFGRIELVAPQPKSRSPRRRLPWFRLGSVRCDLSATERRVLACAERVAQCAIVLAPSAGRLRRVLASESPETVATRLQLEHSTQLSHDGWTATLQATVGRVAGLSDLFAMQATAKHLSALSGTSLIGTSRSKLAPITDAIASVSVVAQVGACLLQGITSAKAPVFSGDVGRVFGSVSTFRRIRSLPATVPTATDCQPIVSAMILDATGHPQKRGTVCSLSERFAFRNLRTMSHRHPQVAQYVVSPTSYLPGASVFSHKSVPVRGAPDVVAELVEGVSARWQAFSRLRRCFMARQGLNSESDFARTSSAFWEARGGFPSALTGPLSADDELDASVLIAAGGLQAVHSFDSALPLNPSQLESGVHV